MITYLLSERGGMYLNVTNRCTNNCIFCFRNIGGSLYRNLCLRKEPSAREVLEAIGRQNLLRVPEIVFCGVGEPLLRLDDVLIPVSREIKARYGKPLRINTNGHAKLLYPNRDVAGELREAGIENVSISLNAENHQKYSQLCRPKGTHTSAEVYEAVVEFVKDCSHRLSTEVTALIFPPYALPERLPMPDIEKVKSVASSLKVAFRPRPYAGPALV
ncbi:MAG: TatD family nuclease-associated radical SAM protein [Nitrososphaeria archaeon]